MNCSTEKSGKQMLQEHVASIAEGLTNPETIDCDWEDGEPNAGEYCQDVLDVEYIVGSDGEYRGARLLVAFGGPNIWIDTRSQTVEGHWWGDYAEERYEDTMGLDDFWAEMWTCR